MDAYEKTIHEGFRFDSQQEKWLGDALEKDENVVEWVNVPGRQTTAPATCVLSSRIAPKRRVCAGTRAAGRRGLELPASAHRPRADTSPGENATLRALRKPLSRERARGDAPHRGGRHRPGCAGERAALLAECRRLLYVLEQRGGRDAEATAEADDRGETRVALAALEQRDLRPVEVAHKGEPLLRKRPLMA